MSRLEEQSLDKLADIIYNILWQDLLEVWRIVHAKMEEEGTEAVRSAFSDAQERFLKGPFEDYLEVRWGMNLCVHCNDNNVEKNGIAYVDEDGDGLEFNQCLNCQIGIIYNIKFAKAVFETYTIGLGGRDEFNGMSIFWNAIVPKSLEKFLPSYEIIKNGQWIGTVSLDNSGSTKFLPFKNMKHGIERDADAPWIEDIPDDVAQALDDFKEKAKEHIEVAMILAE
ncbi:hypothetical protein EU537_04745 [Candidatus Thorarchaeota archaeon]|nr:MAG: hypothetical protein EU537_04745 [Candidatus Thorarchaeota archaeon]